MTAAQVILCGFLIAGALYMVLLLARLDARGPTTRWCTGCGYVVTATWPVCTKCGVVYLRARPRWKRVLRIPQTTWRLYRLRVLGLVPCARLAWAGAISKGDRS